jgi:hypothetical protein
VIVGSPQALIVRTESVIVQLSDIITSQQILHRLADHATLGLFAFEDTLKPLQDDALDFLCFVGRALVVVAL